MIRIPATNISQEEKYSTRIQRTTAANRLSRKVLRSRLNTYFTQSENYLKEELLFNESKLSIALDLWTGGSNHAFIGIIILNYRLTCSCISSLG